MTDPRTSDPTRARRAWDRLAEEGGVVGRGEIARLLEVSPNAATRKTNFASFPEPVGSIGDRPIWLRADVEAWHAVRGKTGRPRKEVAAN